MNRIIRLPIKTELLTGETTSITIPDGFLKYMRIADKCTLFFFGGIINIGKDSEDIKAKYLSRITYLDYMLDGYTDDMADTLFLQIRHVPISKDNTIKIPTEWLRKVVQFTGKNQYDITILSEDYIKIKSAFTDFDNIDVEAAARHRLAEYKNFDSRNKFQKKRDEAESDRLDEIEEQTLSEIEKYFPKK